jgi:hypothetical protein
LATGGTEEVPCEHPETTTAAKKQNQNNSRLMIVGILH